MNLISKAKSTFSNEIYKAARINILKKLQTQGIDHRQLDSEELAMLIEDEAVILESDTKKVGLGIGIGAAISLLTGF